MLACSSVTHRGCDAAHIHLPFDYVTYNIDQTLELTVMSVICSTVILYAEYLAKTLCMVRCWNKKCSETGLKRCCSGRNSTSTRSGTISNHGAFMESFPFVHCLQQVTVTLFTNNTSMPFVGQLFHLSTQFLQSRKDICGCLTT